MRKTIVSDIASASNAPPLLKTEALSKNFKGLQALKKHNLEVRSGEILGVIGPNGSGKSTLFNVITGFSPPSSGSVVFDGTAITGWRPDRVVGRGIARTFQGSRLFKALTAAENVEAAAQKLGRPGLVSTLTRLGGYSRHQAAIRDRARAMIDLVGLAHWSDRRAGDLPYGAQRRLEIARAMATGPKLLMLDEPAAGLNTHETAELMGLIRGLRDGFGVAIVVVEHDMDLIGNLCERVQVLAQGELISEGTFDVIQKDARVRRAYLGDD
jgi:branched-chain amino acid transport system ATP-binding protein